MQIARRVFLEQNLKLVGAVHQINHQHFPLPSHQDSYHVCCSDSLPCQAMAFILSYHSSSAIPPLVGGTPSSSPSFSPSLLASPSPITFTSSPKSRS
ncbi:hypothetical protein C8R48DRAFT_735848 [Suillus tomentosus]|nr:hypothetical protein C8R48DRAFT_735848 [Suillus tomentosus]